MDYFVIYMEFTMFQSLLLLTQAWSHHSDQNVMRLSLASSKTVVLTV